MELFLVLAVVNLFLSGAESILSCRDYLSRRVEGVFHYDRHSRYQLAFDDALMACTWDFGAEMASREQLEVAYRSGLEECRAGWLISAEVAYPRIHSNWKCGENKTGIITYGIRKDPQEKWDVFCYKLDNDCSQYEKVYPVRVPSHVEGTMYSVGTAPDHIGEKWPTKASSTEKSQTTLISSMSQDKTPHPPQPTEQSSFSAAYTPFPEDEFATDPPMVTNVDNTFTAFPSQQRISFEEFLTESILESTSAIFNEFTRTTNGREGHSSLASQGNTVDIGPEPSKTDSSSDPTQLSSPSKTSTLPLKSAIVSVITLKDPTIRNLEFTSPAAAVRAPSETVTSEIDFLIRTVITEAPLKAIFGTHVGANIQITSSDRPFAETTPVHPTMSASKAADNGDCQKSSLLPASDEMWGTTSGRGDVHATDNEDDITSVTTDFHLTSITKEDKTLDIFLDKPGEHAASSKDPVFGMQFGRLWPDETIWKTTAHTLPLNTVEENTSNSPKLSPVIIDIATNVALITEKEIDLERTEPTIESSANVHSVLTKHLTHSSSRGKTPRPADISLEPTLNLSTLISFLAIEEWQVGSSSQEQGGVLDFTVATSYAMSDPKTTTFTEEPAKSRNQMAATQSPKQHFALYEPLDTCGGVLRGKAGQFQSPGFPLSYQSDMDCTWVIESPVGHRVVLDFLQLALEEHRTCQYDYVLVYDKKDKKLQELGRFCGSQLPLQLRSTSNVMTLVMRSDSSVELDGFLAQFSTVKSSSESVRLVGGRNLLEGLVEVEHQGLWAGICAKRWEQTDAEVVCRQLGYSGPATATRRISLKSSERVSVSYVKCSGEEATLENCNLKHSGHCGTEERAGVICQVLESCAALKSAGVLESGVYTIDPDGTRHGEDPFPVKCDMLSEKATGITIIGHDSEVRERISPCEDAGCYSRNITYKDASLGQLRALTAVSETCEQFVKLECRHIRFLKDQWGWWVSRDGQKVNSWGGASTNSGKCSCGEKGACAQGLPTCNCDANDGVWRMDEGLLTDKSMLPIQAVHFGDTRDVPVEMAFHSIGKFRCRGNGLKHPVLPSCAALKDAGHTDSGFYVIDPDGPGQGFSQFEVYCDMTSDPTTGVTEVSHDSENRIRVNPCEEAGCYHRELQYGADLAQLNALTKVSDSCEQYVRLDCRHIRFIQSGWGWWVSWNGEKMFNWGGASRDSNSCACGMTGSCAGSFKLCNCDNNDHIWRTDDGYLRDKHTLPVKAVYLGDTQDPPLEMAYHTIGKLRCRGRGFVSG
ncbi:uncharacterized protein [Ambystoma mexicanum]|uniref:uncharacterized protein isoform X2 n=1 Tax=Ambystoma mexicanum TaxID=8296 RepID=UPI0037E9A4D9